MEPVAAAGIRTSREEGESAEAELKHLLGKGSQTFSVIGEWLERVRENFKPDKR